MALAVAQHAELSAGAKLVYGALRYAAGRGGERCRVSLRTICRQAGLSKRQAINALVQLYKHKLIEVERDNGRASGYRLLADGANRAAAGPDGFLVVPLAVAQSAELTPSAKLVYGALRRAAGRGGDKCSPARRWLGAQQALRRIKTVRLAIGALVKSKAIEVTRQPGQASSYRLLIVEAQPKPAKSEQPAQTAAAAVGANGAPAQPGRRLTRRERVEQEALALLAQKFPAQKPPDSS